MMLGWSARFRALYGGDEVRASLERLDADDLE